MISIIGYCITVILHSPFPTAPSFLVLNEKYPASISIFIARAYSMAKSFVFFRHAFPSIPRLPVPCCVMKNFWGLVLVYNSISSPAVHLFKAGMNPTRLPAGLYIWTVPLRYLLLKMPLPWKRYHTNVLPGTGWLIGGIYIVGHIFRTVEIFTRLCCFLRAILFIIVSTDDGNSGISMFSPK